jgi:YXWGXW repeat-containing protein
MRSITTQIRTLAASLALVGALACAGTMSLGVVYAERRPPRDRVEVVVASPGPGYAWVRGYWRWDRNDYFWVPGRWERVERGYHRWVPGHWTQRHHRWYWVEGHWAR